MKPLFSVAVIVAVFVVAAPASAQDWVPNSAALDIELGSLESQAYFADQDIKNAISNLDAERVQADLDRSNAEFQATTDEFFADSLYGPGRHHWRRR